MYLSKTTWPIHNTGIKERQTGLQTCNKNNIKNRQFALNHSLLVTLIHMFLTVPVVVYLTGLSKEKRRRNMEMATSHSSDLSDTIPCAICHVRFCDDVQEKNGRSWIECGSCKQWYHNACQGLDELCSSAFVCISCDS